MEEKSFAEMLEESFEEPVFYEPGAKVEAEVISIGREYAFINLGGKSEGYFSLAEVTDENGEPTIKVGDRVEAYFLSAGKGGMLFTTKLGSGAESSAHLEDAFRNRIPVEGTVEKEIKGGFSVRIAGAVRAFCPFSQIGLPRAENEEVIGEKLPFLIIEYRDNGRTVVVSHRRVKEMEREARRKELQETLQEGAAVKGVVTSLQKFGAFVDIGGLEGLLPISEVAWSRVEDIGERLFVGQELDLVVLRLDWENDRFSFSLKQAMSDPWEDAAGEYPEGSIHTGVVARLVNFGAFVTLGEGVDGLIHISRLGAGRRINHPREVVSVGQEVEVKVESVNSEERRISLALVSVGGVEVAAGGGKEDEDTDNRREFEQFRRQKQGRGGEKAESLGTLGDLLAAKLKGK